MLSGVRGSEGWICYWLGGAVSEGWGLRVTSTGATASPGFPTDPAVTLKLTIGAFVRFSLGAVSTVTQLTEERLRLDGDLMIAAKLAPMFGRPLDGRSRDARVRERRLDPERRLCRNLGCSFELPARRERPHSRGRSSSLPLRRTRPP